MKFWKNHEDIIKKAAVLTGAIAVAAMAVFGIFFLMNKEAVIHYVSKKTGSENITEVFENGDGEITADKIRESEKAELQLAVSEEELLEGELSGENIQKENLSEDSVKTESEEGVSDDLRIHGFPYIELTSQLKAGDYVDVRISFADGEDFIVLSRKQIQGLAPLREGGDNALWLIVSEEEIQRLASAVVDICLNEGSSIYAIEYISEKQKAADVNYVVRDFAKESVEEGAKTVYPEQEEIIYLD